MAHGNQWMNPTFYKNMTNEQVDWTSLAQQWIKMKEISPSISPGQQVKIPISEHSLFKHGQHVDVVPQNPANVATVKSEMIGDHNIATPDTRNNMEKPRAWKTWTLQQQQSIWYWESTSSVPPTKAPVTESVNSLIPSFVSPKLSESPPSFPMLTPNRQYPTNNYWAGSNTTVPAPSESDQCKKLKVISKVDSKTRDPSFIDAAKRKQLPAWIREGLEKMEREKRRKIELKQLFGEPDYTSSMNENVTQELLNLPINFDHETQMIDDDIEHLSSDHINEPKKTVFLKNDPSPLIPYKTKTQIWEDTMLSLRKILTKLLMDVTNDMMLNVVKEVLKTTQQIDIQENQNQISLTGKLGLEVYNSEFESSDESNEGCSSSDPKQLKQDSNEAIQERILKRKREFSNIEARILMELDHLEDKEKLVRSKFDNSIMLSGEMNDIGSQVVENIQTKGCNEDVGSNLNIDKSHDKVKKDLYNDLNIENEYKKKESESKTLSSSSSSSSSSDRIRSNNTDNKYNYKKNDKIESKSLNYGINRKRRSQSINKIRSHSRQYGRMTLHSFRSSQSQSPLLSHSYFRKYKSKRNSSSSSNESSSNKHGYKQ